MCGHTIYNFIVQVRATYKGLFGWLNWTGYASNVIFRPIIMVIIFSILGRFAVGSDRALVIVLGISVQSMAYIILGGIIQTYGEESAGGTLSFIYFSRVNRLVNYLSRPVLHFPNGLLAFIASLVTAVIITGMDFGLVNWAGFILAVFVTSIAVTGFTQSIGVLTIVSRNWVYVFATTQGILMVFNGVVIPIMTFPSALQELTKLLPITNGLFAVRATFLGAPFAEVGGYIVQEFITGAAYTAIGAAGFMLVEAMAKRTGALNLTE